MRFNYLNYLPKSVIAVCIANMFVAISVAMTFSVSPFFIRDVLGVSLLSLGAIEGFSEGLSQLMKLFAGVSTDLSRRKKPMLILGYTLALLSKPFFIFAPGAFMVTISKVIERMSNGMIGTPRDAYLAEASPVNKRGESLGLMMTLKTFGCALGSFLIATLIYFTQNYRLLLLIGTIPCVFAIYIVWRYLEESKNIKPIASGLKNANKFLSHEIKNLPSQYWIMLGIAGLFMVARVSDSFLALRLQEIGAPLSVCTATIGIFNVISAVTCLPIGRLSDCVNRSTVLYISFLSLLLCYLCFTLTENLWVALIGVIFWGAQRASSQVLFVAIISDLVAKRIMGTALGLFYLMNFFAAFISGIVCGKISESSLQKMFFYAFCVSVIALFLLYLRNRLFEKPVLVKVAT